MDKNEEYLTKLHSHILIIMDKIHQICVENNIRYYLCGGSLLGAVRHHGFIPWDDDLDIMMPRNDFDRFINLLSSKSDDLIYLDWHTTNKMYSLQFAKVCLKGTLFQENHSNNKKLDTKWGIFVDVFPIDLTCDNINILTRRKKHYSKWCSILSCKSNTSCSNFLKRIAVKCISRKTCFSMLRKIATREDSIKKNYTRFGSQYSVERVTYPIDSFGVGVLLKFENRMYFVPNDYCLQLLKMFGNNYMDIPPVEKRRTHVPKTVVFLDGNKIEFEKPLHTVTIEETLR